MSGKLQYASYAMCSTMAYHDSPLDEPAMEFLAQLVWRHFVAPTWIEGVVEGFAPAVDALLVDFDRICKSHSLALRSEGSEIWFGGTAGTRGTGRDLSGMRLTSYADGTRDGAKTGTWCWCWLGT